MCLPCASPTPPRPPPSPPTHNAPGPGGVSRRSYLRRKTHSRSGHRRGSMLIVASWEEINKAIKGDITVCLGPGHNPPPSPQLVSGGRRRQPKGQPVWGFDPRDETALLGSVGGKRRSGTPDSSGGGADLLDGLRSAACRQGGKALAPGERALASPDAAWLRSDGNPQEVGRGATLNCWWTQGLIKRAHSPAPSCLDCRFSPIILIYAQHGAPASLPW